MRVVPNLTIDYTGTWIHIYYYFKKISLLTLWMGSGLLAQAWILNYLPHRKLPEDTAHGGACKHTCR